MKDEQLAYDFHREVHVLWAKEKIVLVFEMMKGKKYEHLKISHDKFVVVALSNLNGVDRFRDLILSLELYHIKSPPPIGLLHFCSGLHVRRLCTRYCM